MPAADLALLEDAARAAGRIALDYFLKDPKTWEKDDAQGPVTEADLAVDAMLREHLLAARPDHGWLSEETEDDKARLEAEAVFVVDPIDGTRAFIAGQDSWAHSLALVRDGEVQAGVVYLPVKDLMYSAERGSGATVNGQPLATSTRSDLDDADFLVNRAVLQPDLWPGGVPEVKRHFRPSLAWRMALVAEGRFDGMITLRPAWEWDIAAGALIATEAGATVSDRQGTALRFNAGTPKADGVLLAPPVLHAGLMARLHPGHG